jgi:hypothetical protein
MVHAPFGLVIVIVDCCVTMRTGIPITVHAQLMQMNDLGLSESISRAGIYGSGGQQGPAQQQLASGHEASFRGG